MNISIVLVTSVAPRPGDLCLSSSTGGDRRRHHHQPPSTITVCAVSCGCFPFGAPLLLRAKRRKRLGGKSCVRVFLLRQARKSDDDAETRAKWTRVRDARAQKAEGARMSSSLLRMEGQLRFMLPPYGVMLPVKWNRLHNYLGVTTVAASELLIEAPSI